MTPDEWDTCAEPQRMLSFLRESGKASERKPRLFVLAGCRRARNPLQGERAWEAVLGAAERRAEGEATRAGVLSVAMRVNGAEEEDWAAGPPRWATAWPVAEVVFGPLDDVATFCRRAEAHAHEGANDHHATLRAPAGEEIAAARAARAKAEAAAAAERACQCSLLRDLLGDPTRPVALSPSSLTPAVLSLARASYEERLPSGELDNARLAVLADALLDAGCDDAGLLEHLRGEAPHWRGCFALDAVLGKS